jgi:N-acetylglucosaminyldiphosphoundecaprenol N-acetyl-beta-D-mannosaminyltransferase
MRQESLFGLGYDLHSKNETICIIRETINDKQFKQICRSDINVSTIVSSQDNEFLRTFINQSEIVNIDGMGAILGCKILKKPVPERIAGADLFEDLLSEANNNGYSVYFLGATEEVVKEVVTKSKNEFTDLIIAGYHNGYFWDNQQDIVDKINKVCPDLLFIGTKSPEKELFINEWRTSLKVKVLMGVGGTFDVYTGKVNRAPQFIQRMGCEWLFRLIQEPKRMWRRYLYSNTAYMKLLIKEKLGHYE